MADLLGSKEWPVCPCLNGGTCTLSEKDLKNAGKFVFVAVSHVVTRDSLFIDLLSLLFKNLNTSERHRRACQGAINKAIKFYRAEHVRTDGIFQSGPGLVDIQRRLVFYRHI